MIKTILMIIILNLIENTNTQIGYVYIDKNPSDKIILAETKTLSSLNQTTLTIRTTITPQLSDIDFIWSITPINTNRFIATEGFATIKQFSNWTQIRIAARDTFQSNLNDVTYFFKLDRLTTNFVNLTQKFYFNNSAVSFAIALLPSNYPFGYFQFSDSITKYLTVSRYSYISLADSIRIDRKYGANYRVLIEYKQIEVNTNKTVVNFIEFGALETYKIIKFSSVYKNDLSNKEYPRNFVLQIAACALLDGVPEVMNNEELIAMSNDILPKIGNFSTVYITVIDDKSIIEFTDTNLNVDSIYKSQTNVTLTITRSRLSNLNNTVLVNFITVPLYLTSVNSVDYYPARASLDYTPQFGQFIFEPDSQSANVTFRIYQNDDYYFNNLNRKFRVYLQSIANCDGCQLGFRTEANLFINAVKEPFRNLLKWNDLTLLVNDTIYLNPSVLLNKVCVDSRVDRALKLDFGLIATDYIDDLVLDLNYKLSNGSDAKTLYFDSLLHTECIEMSAHTKSNITIDKYCFNINYLLQMNTSYVINHQLDVYSPIISSDSFKINVFNTNCALTVQIDTSYLIINNNYIDNKTNGSVIKINLFEYQSDDFLVQIPLKVLLNKNILDLKQTQIDYQIDIDPRLANFISNTINSPLQFNLNLTSTPTGITRNNLILYFKNMSQFPFYLLSFNVTLLNNRFLKLFKLAKSTSVKIELIAKKIERNNCGIISLDRNSSKFNYLNGEREITLAFDNDISSSSSCVLNALYSINIVNKTSLIPIDNIYKYIPAMASNFYNQFTPIKNAEKQIFLNDDVYIDYKSGLLVNITSLISVQTGTIAFIKSVADSQILIEPSFGDSNGPAQLNTFLYYQLNLTNPYDTNNYNLKVNINLNRLAFYAKCRANLELLLIDPLNKSIPNTNAINKGIAQIELTLQDGEITKAIDLNIQYLVDDIHSLNADLILFGNICFFNEQDLNVYCSKLSQQLYVEPDGIFQFSNNSVLIIDNHSMSNSSIEYNIERRYGSLNTINLFYSLTSSNQFTDFYFQDFNTNLIQFQSGQVRKQFTLHLRPVLVDSRRDFFIYLTNTQTLAYETRKISKYDYFTQISILPTIDYIDAIVFSQKYLIVPLLTNITELNLTISLNRIGLIVNNPIYCSIKSAGNNELIPNYIQSEITRQESLAYANYDYRPVDSIIKFENNNRTVSVTLLLKSNFTFDSNDLSSRYFYLYLSEPTDGARLIEPLSNTAYTPFMRLEFRKVSPLADLSNSKEKIRIGFLNDSLTSELRANFVFILKSDRFINNELINELYELEWTAELITNNESNFKINNLIKCALFTSESKCGNIINCNSSQIYCNLTINFKLNTKLYNDFLIKFELKTYKSIIFLSDYLTTEIDSNASVAYLKLSSNRNYAHSIGFNKISEFNINNKLKLDTDLTVELETYTNETVTIYYRTQHFANIWFHFKNIKVYTADPGYDYEETAGYLTFTPGLKSQTINIKLRAAALLDSRLTQTTLYPRMFQVVLFNCSPDCNIVSSVSNVTILAENINLWRVYREVLNENSNENLDELEQLSLNSKIEISTSQSDLIIETLREMLSQQKNLIIANKSALANIHQEKIMTILCNLMGSNRASLNGAYNYLNLLEDTLYSYLTLNNSIINSSFSSSLTLKLSKFSCPFDSFKYSVNRINSTTNLTNITYSSETINAIVPLKIGIPRKKIILFENYTNIATSPSDAYRDICIGELVNVNWIQPSKYLLNGRVVLFSTRQSLNSTFQLNPIRIRMLFSRSVQTNQKCSIFNPSLSEWESNFCETSKGNSYIECVCFRRSVYGLVTHLDANYYGFDKTWFYVAGSFGLFSTLSVFLTYFFCLNLYSFSSFCLMQLFASNTLAQLLYLVTVAISSTLIVNEPDDDNSSCIILSLFFHYFILCQFTWIFVCSLTYYLIFVKNIKNSFCSKLGLVAIGWSLPIFIIGIFYLITSLLYEFQFNYSSAFIYSDLFDNKEICFIKNTWAYLGGLIMPSVLLVIISLCLFALIFKSLPNWKAFDDIYLGRLNQTEIKMNLILWFLIFQLNLWAAIHLRYGSLWLFIIFCVFDFLLSLFVIIFYTFQRHILQLELFRTDLNLSVTQSTLKIIKTEDLEPKSSNDDSTIDNSGSLTSDLNRLVNIFKTTSSINTINSSLSVQQQQQQENNSIKNDESEDDINKELNDLKLLLKASQLIDSKREDDDANNKMKYDHDRDELETEIKEEYEDEKFEISKPTMMNPFETGYDDIFEISNTEV